MSNSSRDRDLFPDGDGGSGQKRNHNDQSKDEKRKRKLAMGGSRAQHRHRRRHHHHHNHREHQQEHEAQNNGAEGELLEHFRRLVQEQDGVALNALLAAGNNIEMAAQLWMDDLIASQAVANPRQEREERKMAAASRKNESSDEDDDDSSNPPSPKNLEREFGRAAGDNFFQPRRRAENNNEDNNGDAEDAEEEEDQNGIEQRQRQRQIIRDAIQAASVSDDEGNAGIWKQIRNRLPRNNSNDLGQRVREAAAAVADNVLADSDSPHATKRMNANNDEDAAEDIDTSEWWLMEPTVEPFGPLLWGASGASVNENEFENVVADEDADEKAGLGIPHTWLHASFSLSKCGNGLAIQAPKVEDIEFFTWRQQQNQDASNGIPPPHHCRAITAIMSIVTAILYTGASIQGNDVNCTSARKPFADLSLDEKNREYESRLADALAALIFVAAQASLQRRKRSMSREEKTGSDNVKAMLMKRRLHLIPTCQWEDEPSLPRQPDSPSYRYIQVAMSLTNIDDIRLFVLSNIRSFTSPGGVALLLETILRIHGKGVIARMVERARKVSGRQDPGGKCLVNCSCERRAKKMYETPLPANVRNNPSKLLDTTPPGHECVGVELISLLMTGTVHATWKTWSTDFEFGVLTKKNGEVGSDLARPEKPVWLLQGDTCYSLLWLGGGKEDEPQDLPGAVLDFVHWNCWYELRNKTEFRLISASNVWKPPKKTALTSDSFADWRNPLESRCTTELLVERRRKKRMKRVTAEEHKNNLAKSRNVTATQLEKVSAHPEDEKFYPKDYKMWRFDMGTGVDENNDDSCEVGDTKIHVERWVPYHRLPAEQKVVVDLKQGPKITAILWTRWPGARIENFNPWDGIFPTV